MSARMHLLLLLLLWATKKHTYLVLYLYPNKQLYLTGFTSFLSFWIKLTVCSIIKIHVLLIGFFVRNSWDIMSNNIDVQAILTQESDLCPILWVQIFRNSQSQENCICVYLNSSNNQAFIINIFNPSLYFCFLFIRNINFLIDYYNDT